MATLNRYRVIWTGGPGGEGVSTFYALPTASTALADIRTFFDSIKGLVPAAFSWTFPNSGDQIEDSTGQISGAWSAAAAPSVVGTSVTTAYAAGVGARVSWQTQLILNGRRLRGTTYITSLSTSSYDTTGTLQTSSLTTLQNAADALIAATDLVIYSRPHNGSFGYGLVIGATVPDRVTALRSRRY